MTTSQIPGRPVACGPYSCLCPCAWANISSLRDRYLEDSGETAHVWCADLDPHDAGIAVRHSSKCASFGCNITLLAGKWQESMSMSVSVAIGLTHSFTARVLQVQGANKHNHTKNEVQTGFALQDSSLAVRTAQDCSVNTPRRFLRALEIA